MTYLEKMAAERYLEMKVACYRLEQMLGKGLLNHLAGLGYIYQEVPGGPVEVTGNAVKQFRGSQFDMSPRQF